MAISYRALWGRVNLTSRVYYNNVILPTEITFYDLSQSKSNKIKFLLDFQICKEICIPVSKDFIIDLQPENYFNNKSIEKIKSYDSYVPIDIKLSQSLKGNNITNKKKTVIIELDKENKKKLLNNGKESFIFLSFRECAWRELDLTGSQGRLELEEEAPAQTEW